MAYMPPYFETPEEKARRMQNAALGLPAFAGTAESTYQANHGSAPYAEAAAKARFRLSLQDRLLAALSGLGYVHPGSNFGQAFLQAAGGSARATWAAKQAAMNYAQRQADQEQRDQDRQATIEDRQARTQQYIDNSKAYTAHLLKLEQNAANKKPERLVQVAGPNGPIWVRESDAVGKSVYVKPGKGPAGPKPPHPREAVMKRLDLINMADPRNPEHVKRLKQIIDNPATPEEKAAAEAKIKKVYGPLFNVR